MIHPSPILSFPWIAWKKLANSASIPFWISSMTSYFSSSGLPLTLTTDLMTVRMIVSFVLDLLTWFTESQPSVPVAEMRSPAGAEFVGKAKFISTTSENYRLLLQSNGCWGNPFLMRRMQEGRPERQQNCDVRHVLKYEPTTQPSNWSSQQFYLTCKYVDR